MVMASPVMPVTAEILSCAVCLVELPPVKMVVKKITASICRRSLNKMCFPILNKPTCDSGFLTLPVAGEPFKTWTSGRFIEKICTGWGPGHLFPGQCQSQSYDSDVFPCLTLQATPCTLFKSCPLSFKGAMAVSAQLTSNQGLREREGQVFINLATKCRPQDFPVRDYGTAAGFLPP